jgi:hypothetical protein
VGQIGVLEAREGLVGEAHHEQPDPAEDLGLAVGVHLMHPGREEIARQPDPQQQVSPPGGAQRQHDHNARLEEGAVDGVRRARGGGLLGRDGRQALKAGTEFLQQRFEGDVVGVREEGERLARPQRAAATAQAVAIQHGAQVGCRPQQVGDQDGSLQHSWGDLHDTRTITG